MSYGMTYDEFWYESPYRTVFYRKAKEIAVKQRDEELWMQGVYIYDALCRVSPILHAFSKSGTKPLPYMEKPYLATVEENKNKTQEMLEQEAEYERLKAQIQFKQWAKAVQKQYAHEEGGSKNV